MNTPLTIRSASPNSLSIAKALSLLSNAGNVHITITEGTPMNNMTNNGNITCSTGSSKSSSHSSHHSNPNSVTKMIASPLDNLANHNSNSNLNYSHLPEQFLATSSQLSETDHSGDNSANTSVELTDGDYQTNSDHENNLMATKIEEVIANHMMLSPNTSIVIHVEQ
jgi:hypothetical protein